MSKQVQNVIQLPDGVRERLSDQADVVNELRGAKGRIICKGVGEETQAQTQPGRGFLFEMSWESREVLLYVAGR